MTRVAVLIDAGHLRVRAKFGKIDYTADFVEKVAHACAAPGEEILRILYYDCALYHGEVKLPVSGGKYQFHGHDGQLRELAAKDLFAVRRGVLKFRGWVPKKTPLLTGNPTDSDFKATFEQKGVDMRIGLDFANFATTNAVDRIILLTNDTDCVPAMKHARKAGLQVVIVSLPEHRCAAELVEHADCRRPVIWP